jgi:hypothetical protein
MWDRFNVGFATYISRFKVVTLGTAAASTAAPGCKASHAGSGKQSVARPQADRGGHLERQSDGRTAVALFPRITLLAQSPGF